MAIPWSANNLDPTNASGIITGVPAAQQYNRWSAEVILAAEFDNPLTLLESSGEGSPIRRINQNLGLSYTDQYMHDYLGEPYKMDKDIRDSHFQFDFAYQTFSVAAWGASFMTSELQKQYPNFDIYSLIKMGAIKVHGLWGMRHGLHALAGENWADAAATAIHTGVYSKQQIYAGHVANVAQLGEDDIFASQMSGIAKMMMYSGYVSQGVEGFMYKRPTVPGWGDCAAVCLMPDFVAYDLEYNDPDFKAVFRASETGRGPDSEERKGLSSMFRYKDVIYMVLNGEAAKCLLFDAGDSIYDADGVAHTAAVNGARVIYLGADAAVHIMGRYDRAAVPQQENGDWFDELYCHRIEGYGCRYLTHPVSEASSELGRVVAFVACHHQNYTN